MMRKLSITNIDWETRGLDSNDLDLPSEVTLENVPEKTVHSVTYADEVADMLYLTYGRCRYHVNGFSSRVLE